MRWLTPGFGVLIVILAGCSGGPKTASVSGVVKLDGKPLANVHVNFQPQGKGLESVGPGSVGKTDVQGRYTLRLINPDREGAVVGKHRVSISGVGDVASEQSDAGVTPPFDPVPPKYSGPNSALSFVVPAGGTKDANFDLETKPK